ncbi:hypothetical protein BH09ACT7_BH09ACT7_55080 [soil metagenome]
MTKFSITTITAGALTAAALGFAGSAAAAAPVTVTGSAASTISSLKAQGYDVIVTKVGGHRLGQCSVSAVRDGQEIHRTNSAVPGAGSDVVTRVVNKTVYVDLRC